MKNLSLIIPDIHLKHEVAEKIIRHVGADEIIFLGDYFDDFNDTPQMVRETSEWLVESTSKPNRIHLFGNHEVGYAFGYKYFKCRGYTQWKHMLISDIVPQSVWNKLKFYHFLDNRWLLSHAGLHSLNVPDDIKAMNKNRVGFIQAISDWLDVEIQKGMRCAANNTCSWIFNAGRCRGGTQRVGGLIWCDYEAEFYPVKGINQIVGHTPDRYGVPKWCVSNKENSVSKIKYSEFSPTIEVLDDPDLSVNIDLDVVGNMHYGIWDGHSFTVGNYRDL